MESGLFYGYVGMVEGLVRRMTAELGGDAHRASPPAACADVIAPETTLIRARGPISRCTACESSGSGTAA